MTHFTSISSSALEKGVRDNFPASNAQFGQAQAPFQLRKTRISESAFVVQLATIVNESKASGNSLGLQFFLIDLENVQPTDIGSLMPTASVEPFLTTVQMHHGRGYNVQSRW